MTETIINFSVNAYTFLLPLSWIGIAIFILILIPMAMFKGTRGPAGVGMYFASILFGLTTWFLGAAVSFAAWGWIGFLIGVFLAGVGVVPIGIAAAFFAFKNIGLGVALIVMSIIVFVARGVGMTLIQESEG